MDPLHPLARPCASKPAIDCGEGDGDENDSSDPDDRDARLDGMKPINSSTTLGT